MPRRYRFPASAGDTTALMVILSALVGIIAVIAVVWAILAGTKVNQDVAHIRQLAHINRALIDRVHRLEVTSCKRIDDTNAILALLANTYLSSLPHKQRLSQGRIFLPAIQHLAPKCTKGP